MLIRDFGNWWFLHIMPRWIAGPDAQSALACCRKHAPCTVNYLGEHYTESPLVRPTVEEYLKLADLLASAKAGASISIKPSQFGFSALDVEDPRSFCEDNMLEVVRYAGGRGVFVWLDMEDSHATDFTLDFYCKYAPKYPLGICIQANLLRTGKDLERLIALSKSCAVRVRLVKGTYPEPPEIAVPEPEVHAAFLRLIRSAFSRSNAAFGIAVGSHHPAAIALALKLQKEHPKKFFEIQMLKGVRSAYQHELRMDGVPLDIYVPYGKDVFAYSVRRAMKDPGFSRNPLFFPFFGAYNKSSGD
jgi:proline dehydrogenase